MTSYSSALIGFPGEDRGPLTHQKKADAASRYKRLFDWPPALVGVALSSVLTAAQLATWGWRVPLALGCLSVPLLFLLRRHLRESTEFETHTPSDFPTILRGLWQARGIVLCGPGLALIATVSFYMITAYTPTFGKLLHLPDQANLWVTAGVGASNLLWLPTIGALSDRRVVAVGALCRL
ncbi:hypothetical protein BH10PSE15_BH10PSE15_13550 [soil metagenome]